jgi:hypothetical protein
MMKNYFLASSLPHFYHLLDCIVKRKILHDVRGNIFPFYREEKKILVADKVGVI